MKRKIIPILILSTILVLLVIFLCYEIALFTNGIKNGIVDIKLVITMFIYGIIAIIDCLMLIVILFK